MPTEYTLSDLVKLTGVTERTVRFYISQGLLPPPTHKGPNARYSEMHLGRLRLIKKMQLAHLPLAEIRRQLDNATDEDLTTVGEMSAPDELPHDSALDYIDTVLGRRPASAPLPAPAPAAPAMSMPSGPMPSMRRPEPTEPPPLAITSPPLPTPSPEPSRAQWERISLDPDVELHIRRPLTRHKNRTIERLITIARQLLEE